MAMIGENQVRNFFVLDSANDATLSAISSGDKVNGNAVNANGLATADAEEFMLALKDGQGKVILSDIINPSNVTYAKGVNYSAREERYFTISDLTADANTLYEIRVIFTGYGSLSIEDEFTISGFYTSGSNDTVEEIIDGLVTNLAYNSQNLQPSSGGTFTLAGANGNVTLPDNDYLVFDKVFTDGTQEETELAVTAADAGGSGTLTVDGIDTTIIIEEGTVADTIAAITDQINAIQGVSATDDGTTITMVADFAGVTTGTSFVLDDDSDGNSFDLVPTVTVTSVDGTTYGLVVSEKENWLDLYYVTGKKDRLDFDFTVQASFETAPTITETEGTPGNGTGYHVRNMEYYFKGNRADSMRGLGYPHNFEQNYDSKLSELYYIIELGYFDEGRDDPMKSKKQLTIAVSDLVAANVIATSINAALASSAHSVDTLG